MSAYCPYCGGSLAWAGPLPHAWDEYARHVHADMTADPVVTARVAVPDGRLA